MGDIKVILAQQNWSSLTFSDRLPKVVRLIWSRI